MRDITAEPFDAVLFDNDGTLTDSTAAVERAWRAWAAHHEVPVDQLTAYHGVPSRSIVAAVVAPHVDVDVATADIDRRELEDLKGVRALPGAADAMAAVGRRAAIVTSAGRELAILRLEAAGLSAPEAFVTADDIIRGKPDPQPYLIAADKLGVDPARCLVVEDAPAGLRSGRAAGSATLAVTTTNPAVDLEPLADMVVPDLSAVLFTATPGGVRLSLR
jgi:mannitol-1-/sugar-/sorbitol-6-phosphatase